MSCSLRYIFPLVLACLLSACSGEPEDSVAKARAYWSEGDPQAAIIQLKSALQGDAGNVEARWLLAEVYYALSAYQDAVKELRKARDLGMADEQVLPLLSRALLEANEQEALQSLKYEQLSAESLSTVLAAQGLGKLRLGSFKAAGARIDQALELNPQSVFAMYAQASLLGVLSGGDDSQVREQLGKVFQADPDYPPAWSLLGDAELRGLNLEQAEQAYSRALEGRANNRNDRYKRAFVRLQQQKYDGVEEDLAMLETLAPGSPGTEYLKGVLLFHNGELEEAVAPLQVAQQYENRYPQALFYLATIQSVQGNFAQAEDYAYRYLGIFPESASGGKLLATIQLQMDNVSGAQESLRTVIASHPKDVAAHNLLAGTYLTQGKTAEAVQLLATIVELQPDSAQAQLSLGSGLIASGDTAAGLEHIEAALSLDSQLAQADVLLVSALSRQGDMEGALQAVDLFQEKNPDSATPHNLRGDIYLKLKRESDASASFARALELDRGNQAANENLALLAINKQDYAKAHSYYQNILAVQEHHLPTLLKLAVLAKLEGQPDAELAYLQQAVEQHPGALQPKILLARHYQAAGRPDRVAMVLSDLEDADRENPDVINVIGLSQLSREEYHDAAAAFDKLVAMSPDSPQPHYHLGLAHRGLGKFDDMQREFDKALALSPAYIDPRIELTRRQLETGDRDAVVENLKILRELAPDNAEVMQLDAVRARFDGDQEAALKLSRRAFEFSPTSRNMIVLSRQYDSMGRLEDALSLLLSWLQKHPGDIYARLELADLYLAKNDSAQAVRHYLQVLDADANNTRALNNLAWLLRKTEPERALQYAERVVSLAPGSSLALGTMSAVLMEQGEYVKAQRAIQRALELSPGDAGLRYRSAEIYAAAGDADAALATLEAILAEDVDFEEKQQAEQLVSQLRQ